MTEKITSTSPRAKARMAGVLYLIAGQAYAYAEFSVRGKLVVWGDAAATAHNILAHEPLFRWGFAAELISAVCFIAVTLLFYDLFKPVNKNLALLATFFSLTGCGIQALSSLFHYAPLVVLGGERYLGVFKVEQLQALALMFLSLRNLATNIYMEFFGCYNLLIGYLIFRSTFLPRILGVFLAIAGLTYQAFLSPPLASHLFPYLMAPAGALGELSLVLWLMVMGVNPQRWKEQASAEGTLI
jgi:predicted membrane protein